MGRVHQVLSSLLADRRITDNEVQALRDYVAEDGQLDIQDVKFLVEILSTAKEICPAFDDLFFPILKSVILSDGKIDMSEQYMLLKMIYGDGHVRPCELRFLDELRREATDVPAEFHELVETAFRSAPKNWDVEGVRG